MLSIYPGIATLYRRVAFLILLNNCGVPLSLRTLLDCLSKVPGVQPDTHLKVECSCTYKTDTALARLRHPLFDCLLMLRVREATCLLPRSGLETAESQY